MNCGHDATTTSLHYCSQDLGCKRCHQCKDGSTKMQTSVCAQVQNDEVNAEFSSSFESSFMTQLYSSCRHALHLWSTLQKRGSCLG